MKLHLTQSDSHNLITGYADDYIEVNRQRYANNLIVTTNKIINDFASTFKELTENDFKTIVEIKPEIVLLGTGKTHQFLHPRIIAMLSQQGVALECMATGAACRTYNILMSEGRHVAAMLLL